MTISHHGAFQPIGQGLFHSAIVGAKTDGFGYVYDCGCLHPGNRLWRAIESLREPQQNAPRPVLGQGLGFLFLSHMHWDHVSGLARLLKAAGRTEIAVLPYLYPAERSYVLALAVEEYDYQNDDDSDWYLEFLRRPAGFLLDREVTRVIFVRGDDRTRPTADDVSAPPQMPDQALQTWVTLPEVSSEALRRISEREQAVSGDLNSRSELQRASVDHRSSRGGLGRGDWCYRLFNLEPDEAKLHHFQREFDRVRAGVCLEDVLKDEKKRQVIMSGYEQIFGKRRMNDTSLAVLSCSKLPIWQLCWGRNSDADGSIKYRDDGILRCQSRGDWVGILFTGDLPVADCWESFSLKFGLVDGARWLAPAIYQVPHHGAKGSWSEKQAHIAHGPAVISASRNNSYGHPHAEVVLSLLENRGSVCWVTEKHQPLRYVLADGAFPA